eukprot:766513-Hanusia_phi.AAC.11
MYLLLEEARLYRGVGSLISKIEQKFSQLESNHELLQEHMRRTICALEAELESNINETQEILHEIDGEEGSENSPDAASNFNQRMEQMQNALNSIEKCFENLHPNESLLLDKSAVLSHYEGDRSLIQTPCARSKNDEKFHQEIETLLKELDMEKNRRELIESQAKLFGEEFMQLSEQWQTEKGRLQSDLNQMEIRFHDHQKMIEEMKCVLHAKDGEIVALQDQLHASDSLVQEAKERTDSLTEMLKSRSNLLAMEAKKLQDELQASKDAYALVCHERNELQELLSSERDKIQLLQARKENDSLAESPNPVSDVQRLEMNPSRALEASSSERLETGTVVNPSDDISLRLHPAFEEEEQLNFVTDELRGSGTLDLLYGEGLHPSPALRKFVLKRMNSHNRIRQLTEYLERWAWFCRYIRQRKLRISKTQSRGLRTFFHSWLHYLIERKCKDVKVSKVRNNSKLHCMVKAFAKIQEINGRLKREKKIKRKHQLICLRKYFEYLAEENGDDEMLGYRLSLNAHKRKRISLSFAFNDWQKSTGIASKVILVSKLSSKMVFRRRLKFAFKAFVKILLSGVVSRKQKIRRISGLQSASKNFSFSRSKQMLTQWKHHVCKEKLLQRKLQKIKLTKKTRILKSITKCWKIEAIRNRKAKLFGNSRVTELMSRWAMWKRFISTMKKTKRKLSSLSNRKSFWDLRRCWFILQQHRVTVSNQRCRNLSKCAAAGRELDQLGRHNRGQEAGGGDHSQDRLELPEDRSEAHARRELEELGGAVRTDQGPAAHGTADHQAVARAGPGDVAGRL